MYILLIIIITILSYKVYVLTKSFEKINVVIDDIMKGNLNRRFLFKNGKSIIGLCSNLNSLMQYFQTINERRILLEKLRLKMTSDISHDIRTPLTSLIGYVEALQVDKSLSEAEKCKYLDVIYNKSSVLYTLIDGFFEISKLEEDNPIEYQVIDIKEKIQQVFITFYHEFVKENVSPCFNMPEESIFVIGDDKGIERILQNLLLNSLKYGSDGGVIGVNLRIDEDKVWIDVWDKGKGIPENDIGFIFERLYTVESSRNEKLRGSGLGLAIVKKLVEKHNGEIFVKSIPFENTEFSFYLKKHKI